VHELLSDLKMTIVYASETVNDVNASCGIISPQKAV